MDEIQQKVRTYLREEGVTFPRDVIQEFYAQLLRVSGFGLGGLMSAVAKKAGKKGAELMPNIVDNYSDTQVALQVATSFFEEAGLGKMVVVEQSESGITFAIEGGSTFASTMKQGKKPVCAPIASALGGFIETLISRKVSIKETSCATKGDGKCVFTTSLS